MGFCLVVGSFSMSGVHLSTTLFPTALGELLDVTVCDHWVPQRQNLRLST